jgi:pimeloyl-ACP methyl ester carboxylesterase
MTPSNEPAQPASRHYSSQGLKLHYADWGNEGAPVLLLVHGLKDHSRCWDWTAQALRRDWHVIAPDLRGHGDSQWSADGAYLHPFHVFDIADLIDTLGTVPITIVGHSFGGNVCARYASVFPDRVRKLALIDSLGPSDEVLAGWAKRPVQRTREWIAKRRETAGRAPKRFGTVEEATARMAAANPHLSTEQARHLAEHGLRRCTDGYSWKYDPVLGTFLPEDFAIDGKDFWCNVSAPTLLCWGVESWTTNPDKDGRAAAFRDHRTVVFEQAGHWLHHDQLQAFLAVLREFL